LVELNLYYIPNFIFFIFLQLIENEKLPSKICNKCIDELNLSFQFVEKSKKSEQIFLIHLSGSSLDTFPATKSSIKWDSDEPPLTEVFVVQSTDEILFDSPIVKLEEESMQPDCKVKIEDNSLSDDQKDNSNQPKVEHVVQQHQYNTPKLQCKICKKTFIKHYLLNRHMVRHMKKGEKLINQSEQDTEKKSCEQTGECPFCGMFFKTNYTYESHVKNKHMASNVAELSIETNTGNIPVVKKADMEDPQIFICAYCLHEFRKKGVLKKHLLDIHNGPSKIIKCSEPSCKKLFKDTNYMMAHKFRHHDNKCCTICEKSFRRYEGLKTHIHSVHAKQRDHLCPLCGKR
jgi:hypothetical protein